MDLSRYNITGNKEAAAVAARNNARLVLVRWPYMLLVFGIVVATMWITNEDADRLLLYVGVLVGGLVVNGCFAAMVHIFRDNLRTQHVLTALQLLFDMALAGAITYIQGGIEARTTVLYVFPIISAALIFGGKVVTLAAALSGAAYIASLIAYLQFGKGTAPFDELLLPMIFYPAIFLLLGQMIRYLQDIGTVEAREKAYNSFLSLLAHQLKHPASAATTIIDAIDHNDTRVIDATTTRYIDMLKWENENQIRLIDNLLEAAPLKRAVSFEYDIDIVPLVEKAARRLAQSHERLDDLLPLPKTLMNVKADINPIRLSLALTNIFDNAFRYSEPGQVVHYGVTEKSDSIKILIRDSGKGMSQDEILHQLQRFTNQGIRGMDQGHVGGLGIGLFAADRIARAHGGSLDIHSGEGVGTTVILILKKEQKQ